jgi:chemotaxis protein MotB
MTMRASHGGKRPIIVKRQSSSHEDGHGGQWKVAYADFVTAMMAFFLILWLLSSATQSDRAVIAKYFSTSAVFDLSAGNGVLNGGHSVMDGADAKVERLAPRSRASNGVSRKDGDSNGDKAVDAAALAKDRVERQRFEALKAELERMVSQGELKNLADHLEIEMTSEGLRIQIFDRDGEPMFATGEFEPTPRLAEILRIIAQVLGTMQNAVILTGHTDAQALQRGVYSNWELSADRANAVRRRLEGDGLASRRFIGVEGRAATEPLSPQSPLDPRNRRIVVTVLRSDVERARRASQTAVQARPP